MAEQSDLFEPPSELLGPRVEEVVLDLLSRLTQPSAWELLKHIECQVGLEGTSARYVSRHLKEGRPPKAVSLDMIAKVAGRIERMARETLPSRRPRLSEATA